MVQVLRKFGKQSNVIFATSLKLQVTELDISMFDHEDKRTDLTEPSEEMLEKQAERYEQVFQLFREYKDVITAVTFWGRRMITPG